MFDYDILPTLDLVRDVVETALIDGCKLFRDRQGVLDDMLDRTTGKLVQPEGDEVELFAGECLLSGSIRSRDEQQGDRETYRGMYRFRLPIRAPEPHVSDIVQMTRCRWKPVLAGRRFRVHTVYDRSFALTHVMLLEDEKGAVVR